MDSFDLSGFTPEDIKMLSEQLASHQQPKAEGGYDLEKICQALELITKELETMGERVDNLHKLVMDDLIGSIMEQYQANARSMSISDLQGKYGDMMAPHMPALQALAPDAKIFDELFDLIEQAKGEGGDDWDEDGFVKQQISDLGERLGKAGLGTKPEEPESMAEGEPDASATVTVEKESPKPGFSELARKSAMKMIK